MKAAVLHGVGDIRYEDVPAPQLAPDGVRIRVRSCGICGGDVPRVFGDAAYFFPIILGHEFSGDVVETGENVTTLKSGDTVAGAALLPCGTCEDCRRGHFGSCRNYRFAGSWVNGAFADEIVLPEKNAIAYDPSISYDEAVLFEPCTVALHGVRRSRFTGGSTAAIVGSGTIGRFVLQWLRAFGVERIAVFDVDDARLAAAAADGADAVFRCDDAEQTERYALEATGGRGFAFVYDTAGQPSSVPLCFRLAGVAATICYIGYPTKDFLFPNQIFHQINRKELNIVGSQMSYSAPFPGDAWTISAAMIAKGVIRCDASMIDRRFEMCDAAKAFACFQTPGAVKGKVILYNTD